MSLMSRLAGIPLLAAATAFAAPPPAPAPAPSPSPAPAAKAAAPGKSVPLGPILEGTVVGPDGKPVAEAFVSAWPTGLRSFPAPTARPLLARTDATGRFRLALNERGPHGVRVEVPGLAPWVMDRVAPEAGPLRVVLGKGFVIEGSVKDGPTGIAVAGATVEARDERGRDGALLWEKGPLTARAVTDGQGRYRIAGLGAGAHTVVARARGFGQAARRSVAAGGRADLILYPSGAVTGLVRGPDGKPVPEAKVVVEPAMRFAPSSRVETTDRQGRFEFLGVDPGAYRVVARHKDFAVGWTNITVERQSDTDTAISLDPPLAVTGRLVDGVDRPTRGRVAVSEAAGSTLPPSLASSYTAEVSADGRFRIAGLPGGAAVLSATAPGFGAKRVEVELSPARAETDLGAVAMETGLTISGRVRDKAGQGIPDARVSGQPARRMMMGLFNLPETTTEADGRFVLGGLEPGHYDLSVQASGFGFGRKDADAGAEGVDIVAEPAGALTGTVVDENKQPVTSFRVNIRPVERFQPGRMVVAQGSFRMQTFESPDGRFLMEDLAPAEVSVQVFATDREPASVSSVAVPAGGTADVGQLRVGPGGVIRGAVVDAAGGAVGGATVRSQGPGRDFFMGTSPETATDASGAFELRGLPPGGVNVIATHPAYAAAHTTVDVEPGKPAEARLVLTQGGRIEGRARKRDGSPVAGMINVFSRSSMMLTGNNSTPVGPDGTFEMEHVPVGRLTLGLMLGSGPRFEGSQNQEVEVREGETTNVEFVLRDILVSGRVTRGGTPAPGMRITVRAQSMMFMSVAGPAAAVPAGGPQRLRAVTREDGSYELLVDQPGKVSFMVEAADGSLTLPQRSVEIPDAERHVVDLDYAGLATVSGIVLDEDGETPVARANVYATPKEPRPGMSRLAAETGTDGRFQLEMDPGEYQIGARLQGYGNVPEVVNVGASGITDLRLTVSRGGVVKGRVVDASGRPRGGVFVQGFAINAQGGPSPSGGSVAMSLPDGTFEMSGLADADHVLLVRNETGEYGFTAGVRPGREGLTLTMRRGGRVQVHILGPDGAPVSGAFAMVSKIGETPMMGFGGGPSDSAGLTEVATPAGAVQIRANKDNLEGTASTVVSADGVAALEVRLAPKAASRSGN
jgi:protocatechuate 3,4-dioxygenase beta subunit